MDSLLPGRAAVEISGAAAEGFLNICPAMGVEILSAKRVDEFTLLVELPACRLPLAEKAARRSGCRLRVLRRGGGQRAAGLLRRRALVFCLCACLLGLLFWSKFYIWEIQVNGNETVPTGEILSALAVCGVKSGAFWPEISPESVRSLVLEDMPELAWISVSMSGSLARVEVVERVSPPEMLYKGAAADLVAEKDGFVLSVSAPVGTALVSRGSAVSAGDVLISGAAESSLAPPRFLRAQGSVVAETFTLLRAVSPENREVKSPNGREEIRFALIIGDKRINFYSDSSISGGKCDTIISVWKAEIGGLFSLPIAIVRERDVYYETQSLPTDSAQWQLLSDSVLDSILERSLDGGEILDLDRRGYASGGLVWRELRARCREDIAFPQPMSDQRINEINYNYQQKADETNGGTEN